jgi:NADP-dependent 3-hydroxy acid dehydrogenase YdfG
VSTSLDGTRALVTGATSGLGLAMARALAVAGAAVAVTGRDAARAGQSAAALRGAAGIALDVRDERSVARLSIRSGRGWAASTCW